MRSILTTPGRTLTDRQVAAYLHGIDQVALVFGCTILTEEVEARPSP
jgi:hypothetical protein